MPSPTTIDHPGSIPRLVAALLLGSMTAGTVAGAVEAASPPGRVEPGESFLSHVVWRAVSATIAASACGAVAYPFCRPLTRDGAVLIVLIPISATLTIFHRDGFFYELACFAILMGTLCGVCYRINLDYQSRRDRSSADRHERC